MKLTTYTLDTLGKKCPQPILEVMIKIMELKPGDVLEVLSDCHSFPRDLKAWAEKTKRVVLSCNDDGDKIRAQIQV